MYTDTKRSIAAIGLFMLVALFAIANPVSNAHAQALTGVPKILLQGTFHQPPHQIMHGFPLTVRVGDVEWVFQVKNVVILAGGTSGWASLHHLTPREIHFVGPDNLIAPLTEPAIAGKSMSIKGSLYLASNVFLVIDESEATKALF